MKKEFIFMSIAAMFAACSNESIVEQIEEEEVAINFEGNTEKVTRAEISSVTDLQTPGFAVYGYKYKTGLAWTNWDDTSTGNVVFKNIKVSGSTWTYSGTKYWDKTTAYKFYAVAPYEATPNYSLSTDGKFTISNVASGVAADSKDYIIDRVVNEEVAKATHDKVSFDFHHIMAKVDFKLVKASTVAEDDDVVVESIMMSGWDNATGTFTQSKVDGTWNVLDCSEWSLGTKVAGDVEIVTADATLSTAGVTDKTKTFIMVPQAISALTFTVNYTVGGEPFTGHVGVVADQKWGTDSHLTYTLTIGPSAIQFDVNSVCNFCLATDGAGTVD